MPSDMNESQLKAVQFADGALLLLAGPGSGKTTVITHRIKFLISNHGVSPEKILVITFTKAAAIEMKERFLKLMGHESTETVFGTFHAVFYQILRSSKQHNHLSLITEKDRIKLIRNILKKLHQNEPYGEADLAGVMKQISKYKNDPDARYDFLSDTLDENEFPIFLEEYRQYMTDFGKLDFDDMVLLCYKTLQENSKLLEYWRNRFEYILIDEFQDINKMQYEVVKLLSMGKSNVFVVGDDDQSIYGFRGARPEYMKNFLKDFDHARKMVLDKNYRCDRKIVEAANCIISENKDRFDKHMQANSKDEGAFILKGFDSDKEELAWMTKEIKLIAEKNGDYNNIAILCRTNRDLFVMATILESANLPFCGESYMKTMFDQPYIHSILMYLTYLSGNRSRDVFFQFMNRPLRFIKREAVSKNYVSKAILLEYYEGNLSMLDTIQKLFEQLDRLERMKPHLAVHYIRKVMGFDAYVKEEAGDEQYAEYLRLADILLEFAKSYPSYERLLDGVENMKKKTQNQRNKDGVKLYTYHSSKGLEFDCVFLPGLVQGQVPPKQARTALALEEERRMFYVAMTRAKKYLAITWYENERAAKSSFLNAL